MYKAIFVIVVLLSGCGVDESANNHGYGWEYDYEYEGIFIRGESGLYHERIYSEYEAAKICVADGPPPFIIFITEILVSSGTGEAACGLTKYDPLLILVSTHNSCAAGRSERWLLDHELVHYLGVRGHPADFNEKFDCIFRRVK